MTTTATIPLTARQLAVARWIAGYAAANGYPPTIREVQRHFGYVSTNGAMVHLRPLRKKNVVTWSDGHARTLRVIADLDSLEVVG